MAAIVESNKAKTARRVIEVLEFFDEHHREATVMDIVRRYKRPQSSTSELLASLVELGVLYKDAASRSYTLTPRAAILGSLSQPEHVRDGRLATLIDRLVAQTGLCTALLGMVGLNAQIFRLTGGNRYAPRVTGELAGGAQARLCDTAAGWLLLSTMRAERRDGLLRRMNAEAGVDAKFSTAEVSRYVSTCADARHVVGPAGFGASAGMVAMLLPAEPGERPMALALLYEPQDGIDPRTLASVLERSIERGLGSDRYAGDAPVTTAA